MDTVAKRNELDAARIVVARQIAGGQDFLKHALPGSTSEAILTEARAVLEHRQGRLQRIDAELNALDVLDRADAQLLEHGHPELPRRVVTPDVNAAIHNEETELDAFVAQFVARDPAVGGTLTFNADDEADPDAV